ncbi:OmpA family protein [Vibrio sp. RC27]
MRKSKLDVAPKFDHEVAHPEWGRVARVASNDQMGLKKISSTPLPRTAQATSTSRNNTTHQSKASHDVKGSLKVLMNYFERNSIRYELIPGKHAMLRLLQPIYFQLDSMKMTDQSRDFLDHVARYLANYQGVEMVIEGHTDNTGASAYNDTLSLKRANAVKQWVVGRFSHLKNIYVRGYGSAVPACENTTQSGKACNRRVEVFFILPS